MDRIFSQWELRWLDDVLPAISCKASPNVPEQDGDTHTKVSV